MYTVLVADDERIIREGLRYAMDWEAAGFRIVHFARNGEEAVSMFTAEPTDMALLDVKMPGLSGLDALAGIKRLRPETEVVILSAFDDFQYAKQGMKSGAFDYILKINLIDELPGVIGRVKAKLDAGREKEQEYKNLLNSSNNMLFLDFLNGKAGALSPSDDAYSYFVVVVYGNGSRDAMTRSVGESLRSYRSRTPFMMGAKADNSVFIFRTTREEKDVYHLAGGIADYLRGAGHEHFYIAYGSVQRGVNKIPQCYREAMKTLDCMRERGEMGEGFYERISGAAGGAAPVFDPAAIRKSIMFFNSATLREETASMFGHYLRERALLIHDLRLQCIEIVILLKKEGQLQNADAIIDRINGFDSMLDLREYFSEVIAGAVSRCERASKLTPDDILKAQGYIDEHYAEDVSMEDVAKRFFISPQYFSRRFKEHTGVNFSEYLIGRRISRACELILTTNMKMYEIAAAVGYRDAKHFEKQFAERRGITPNRYRRQAMRATEN